MNNINDLVSNAVQSSLQSFWNNWMSNHRNLAFFISHPIISLTLFIILILTLWGIIQQIPYLLVKFWVVILKSPFNLGKSLLTTNNNDAITSSLNVNQAKLLQEILTQLEAIKNEQINIRKELEDSKKIA
ncbi:hypothetical protein [Geminocystis herdmanii]|uniref:hypothetical protein n=1 Tax=Geminocystis herdmanii TaxID=669359 RepID=UPI000345D6D2|nr:hypothetical protein [Geminocystis herdmanii]